MVSITNNIKKFLRISILQSILSFISFIIFLLWIYVFLNDVIYYFDVLFSLIYFILYLLPFLINLTILMFDYKGKIKRKTSNAISLLLVPLFFIYLIVITFTVGIKQTSTPITDYSFYKKKYNVNNVLMKHFPESIPNNAKNINFYYELGMLQGTTIMKLSYETDDNTIKQYVEKYDSIAIKIKKIDDNSKYNWILDRLNLNEEYNIYYLYENNNKCSFVAINVNENKSIFIYSY